jgi:pSer/pThr/pTyr-binding forkhead associated (FHA) protein
MGFQLVIAEGKEAGREFEFDQASVVIGRTAECDVILYEAGVSRRHARIFAEGDGFFIEDLGSSNGTRVNGAPVQSREALRDGDAIALGPVVFNFKPVELEAEAPTDEATAGGAHTRIVSVSELKKSRNKGVAMLPKGASRDEVAEMGRRNTAMLPSLKGPRPSVPGRRGSDGALARRPAGARLATKDEDLPEGVEVAGGGRPRLARSTGERPALSAAERARLQRGGVSGKAALWWAEASRAQRMMVSVAAGLVGLGLVVGLAVALWPEGPPPKPPEPTVLGTRPIEHSFGLGPGVMYERPDSKSFDFEVKSPVQVMAVIHYQAKDINSREEVSISVNGVELDWVPADTLDVNERSREVLVPAKHIRRNEVNTVTFDNVRNPPENDTWRIWNIWVEFAVLPDKDEDALIADAETAYKRGMLKWEQRDIGASNRWDAYNNFRAAWLTLEAIPPEKRPYTYQLSRDKMNEAKRELDDRCNALILRARSAFNFGKYDEARLELDHVNDYFPSRNHNCQFRAERERLELDL